MDSEDDIIMPDANLDDDMEAQGEETFAKSLQDIILGKNGEQEKPQEEEDVVQTAVDHNEDDVAPVKVVVTPEAKNEIEVVEKTEKKEEEQINKGEKEESFTQEELAQTRERLANLNEDSRRVLMLLSNNPDMTPAEALERIKAESNSEKDTELVSYEDMSASEKIEVDKTELEDVRTKIAEKDELVVRDEEYFDLCKRRDELSDKIIELKVEARFEKDAERQQAKVYQEAETKAEEQFPGLKDETSDLYAAVEARANQLARFVAKGIALPNGWDIKDPDIYLKIAEEQDLRLSGKAPASKTSAQEQANSSRSAKGPVSGKASQEAPPIRPAEGIDVDTPVSLDPDASDEDFFAGLSKIIAGKPKDGSKAPVKATSASRYTLE